MFEIERPKWITIHVERLSPEEKKRKWAAIKKDYPALAEHLNDPVIKQLKERFGATITEAAVKPLPSGRGYKAYRRNAD